MYKTITILCTVFGLTLLSGCVGIGTGNNFEHIPSGNWHCVFMFDQKNSIIPVIMEVSGTDNKEEAIKIAMVSGDYRVEADRVDFRLDTVYCYFDKMNTYLKLEKNYKMDISRMRGQLLSQDPKENFIPLLVECQFTNKSRFMDLHAIGEIKPEGKWLVSTTSDMEEQGKGTMALSMDGKKFTGNITVQDSTLDLNMDFEGIAQNDNIYMSSFDGRHVLGMEAQVFGGDLIDKGVLRINHRMYYWTARRPE
ncbi:MAG: hypothetical protein MK212_10510 [Saprospiraceae bacterium]|nr:hypothetical protein [Saprospiraceae bacterium]